MTTEIELKYLLDTDSNENQMVIEKITALFESSKRLVKMNKNTLANDYFDTDDLSLRKMDFGLRIRTKEQTYEQTIKTAGKVVGCLHQRPEYNVDIATKQLDLSRFPKDIWPENTDLKALSENLQVIFSTNFIRHSWLVAHDETLIELALDAGNIFTHESSPSMVINELELELVRGNTQDLFALAEELKGIVSMNEGKLSKAARGYALFHQQQSNL